MRQISILLWIGLGLAVARLGWVWLVRHDARAHMEDSNQARHGQPYVVPRDDGSVDITQFYARSGQIVDGDSNLICYGVRNAKSVHIEPAVESLHPAPNRCFFVEPHETPRTNWWPREWMAPRRPSPSACSSSPRRQPS